MSSNMSNSNITETEELKKRLEKLEDKFMKYRHMHDLLLERLCYKETLTQNEALEIRDCVIRKDDPMMYMLPVGLTFPYKRKTKV